MIKIYTAGKMYGLSYKEQMEWRNNLENELYKKSSEDFKCIHPPVYYSYDSPSHLTEKEIMDWDLNHLKDCNIMVVNLNKIETSIRTMYEVAMANALNQSGHKHIYIIGFGHTNKPLHPWLELSLHRKEDTVEAATEYIASFLLI